jgi:outer membrane protein OmpA-like peptidoglycan-associated protein
MKKLFLMLAVSMMTASVYAQRTAVTANKAGDNWYIGINAGVATPMNKFRTNLGGGEDYGFMKGVSPEFGVRIGKNLTTVFGLALDINNYFGNKSDSKSMFGSKTFINATDFDILSTWNLNNLFAGYKGEPRAFEVIALVGGGYSRAWAEKQGGINAKAAIDFAFNLGAAKQWQLFIEPGVVLGQPYPQYANPFRKNVYDGTGSKKWNGAFSLKAGINYKFGTSNGTHNFKVEELRDQAEIDALNAKINELRSDVDAKNGQINAANQTINDLKKKLAECEARPATIIEKKDNATLQPHVIFRQGSASVDKAQYASIEMVANYMKNHKDSKVRVEGYASPEGKAEFNQKLSEKRAQVVKDVLVKKYKIAADRIEVKGLGATDKLSDERDFNRVAMFIDTTK